MNRKFVSKSNYVLRKVLNSTSNIDILKDFIESILNLKIIKIYLNSYVSNRANYLPEEENFGIADVRIVLENREEVNVGIQIIDGYYIQTKLLLYYAQIHANQLEQSEYSQIVKTITINILDFIYFSSNDYHKKILIRDNPKDKETCENLELHILELKKFHSKEVEQMSHEEAWMTYLIGENQKKIDKIKEKYKEIQKLDNLLDTYWNQEKME